MMRRVAGLLAALVLLSACSDIGGTGDLEYISGDGSVVQVKPEGRQKPVAISGTTVQGDPLDLADLRGKVVVLNVWGTFCVPCRTEMPMLVEAEAELGKDEVAFVGINIRESAPENAAAFERSYGVDYPSFFDPGSETLVKLGKYVPPAVPATLVLDRDGRVAAIINGPIPSKSTLTTVVEDTLAEDD